MSKLDQIRALGPAEFARALSPGGWRRAPNVQVQDASPPAQELLQPAPPMPAKARVASVRRGAERGIPIMLRLQPGLVAKIDAIRGNARRREAIRRILSEATGTE